MFNMGIYTVVSLWREVRERFFSACLHIAALIGGATLVFFSQVILARSLSPDEYGEVVAVLAAASTIGIVSGMGFGQYLVSNQQCLKNAVVGSCFIFIMLVAVLLSAIYVWLGQSEGWGVSSIGALFLFSIFQAANNFQFSVFQAQYNSKAVILNRVQLPVVRFFTSIPAIVVGKDLFLWGLILASLLLILGKFRRYSESVKEAFLVKSFPPILKSLPYSFESATSVVMLNVVVLYLTYEKDYASLAMVSSGLAFVLAGFLLPQAIFTNFLFPKIVRSNARDPKQLFLRLLPLVGVSGIVGGFVGAALAAQSELLVVWFFGDGYQEASRYLTILAWALPIRYVSVSIGCYIATQDYIRYRAIANLLSLVSFPIFAYALNGWGEVVSVSASVSFVLAQLMLAVCYCAGAFLKYRKNQSLC